MKRKALKYLVGVAMALCLAGTVQAASITGNIGFTGVVDLNTPTSQTATTVNNWFGPAGTGNPVANGSGALIGLMGGNGVTVPISHPWNFTVSSDIASFWTINGVNFELQNYSFTRTHLDSMWSVTIAGAGLMTAANFSPTAYNFSMTFQDPPTGVVGPNSFTFSASQAPLAVPDGGATVMLLGAALSGLALIRRKLA